MNKGDKSVRYDAALELTIVADIRDWIPEGVSDKGGCCGASREMVSECKEAIWVSFDRTRINKCERIMRENLYRWVLHQ